MKIIGISGRKQSGKNTVANYINGYILKKHHMIQDFNINKDGQLEILTSNEAGKVGWGVFDITRKDADFVSYASKALWPYIKVYHFADYLKQICVELFDLSEQQVYGSDEDKNTNTPYDMTAREFLQYFGTDVMRKIKDTIWVDYTIKTIHREQSELAIIPDVRFANEVAAIHRAGGVVVRLDRDVFKSPHPCETALDQSSFDWQAFDHIINNSNMSINDLKSYLQQSTHIWES